MINEKCAKKYCCEDISNIENYELAVNDTTKTWDCHHRGEVLPCGRYKPKDLIKFGLYYKRPASELIFLTHSEHQQLHLKGVSLSEATKKAMSDTRKGVPLSEAHKKAIGEGLKGHSLSEEHKKAISEAKKGISLSEDHKKAISASMKGVNAKKIQQFTKSGEFIREWPSMSEASQQLKINCGHIWSCCNGMRKSSGGYVWKYT